MTLESGLTLGKYLPSLIPTLTTDNNPPQPISNNGQWCRLTTDNAVATSCCSRQSKIFTSIEQPRWSQYIYWIRSAAVFHWVRPPFFDGALVFLQFCILSHNFFGCQSGTTHFSPWAVVVIPSRHQLQSKRNHFSARATANYPVSSWCALVILLFLAIRYSIFNRLTIFSDSSPQAIIYHRQEFCSPLKQQPITQ